MGGYGYTRVIGRTTLTADVLGGYALTNSQDARRVRADMFVLQVGAVYSIF